METVTFDSLADLYNPRVAVIMDDEFIVIIDDTAALDTFIAIVEETPYDVMIYRLNWLDAGF